MAEITGLPITPTGASIEIGAVAPGAWAWQTVEDWRFLLEAMAQPSAEPDAGEGGTARRAGPAPGQGHRTWRHRTRRQDTGQGQGHPRVRRHGS